MNRTYDIESLENGKIKLIETMSREVNESDIRNEIFNISRRQDDLINQSVRLKMEYDELEVNKQKLYTYLNGDIEFVSIEK